MRQPTVTSPLHTLIAAVPVEALRELVLTLLQNGAAQTAPPATPVRRRRRGWPKGKPRGRRRSTRARHEDLPPKARAAVAIAAHPEKTNRAIAEEIGVSEQTVMRARHQMKDGGAARSNRRGKPRRGPGRPRKEIDPGLDAKILAKRKREAERLRVKRAAAKQAKDKTTKAAKAVSTGNGTNGTGAAASAPSTRAQDHTPTQAFWAHAEVLQSTGPWKAVARELGVNLAQAKDCYRKAILPPGLPDAAIERFLELPA